MSEENVPKILDSTEQRIVVVHVTHDKGFVWDADGAYNLAKLSFDFWFAILLFGIFFILQMLIGSEKNIELLALWLEGSLVSVAIDDYS